MKKKDEPKGFNCKNRTCKKWHDFGVYIFAHWDEEFIHTCSKCGQTHLVCRGKVKKLLAWVPMV